MTLRKLVGMQTGVEDLQFEIKPKSFFFEGKITPCFTLYLQKGMQVLGRYQSGTKHNSKDTLYRFRNPQSGVFRVKNINHATYSWNLYAVDPSSGVEQYLDSSNFDLKQTIELYEMDLMDKQREIQTSYKEKNISRGIILDVWKSIKRDPSIIKPVLPTIFSKEKIQLQFQLFIRNSLDLQLLKEEEKKYGLRRAKSEVSIEVVSPLSGSQLASKAKVAEPLIINDDCISPLLRAAKKKNQFQTRKNRKEGNIVSNYVDDNHRLDANDQKRQNKRQDNAEGQQTIVKIMNPSGQEYDERKVAEQLSRSQTLNRKDLYLPPGKKFSMLSDIIEQSYEGSSTYGPDKKSSSNGFHNAFPSKIDQVDQTEPNAENKNAVSVESPLNKFKTLPHDNYQKALINKNHFKTDLRRAQTACKSDDRIDQNEIQNMSEDYIKQSQVKQTQVQKPVAVTSGDVNAKYIIVIAILVILGIIGKQLFAGCKGPNCKNIKKRKLKL